MDHNQLSIHKHHRVNINIHLISLPFSFHLIFLSYITFITFSVSRFFLSFYFSLPPTYIQNTSKWGVKLIISQHHTIFHHVWTNPNECHYNSRQQNNQTEHQQKRFNDTPKHAQNSSTTENATIDQTKCCNRHKGYKETLLERERRNLVAINEILPLAFTLFGASPEPSLPHLRTQHFLD